MKKTVEIKVEPYLYKFIKWMEVKGREKVRTYKVEIPYVKTKHAYEYFATLENYRLIKVELRLNSIPYSYGYIKMMDSLFRKMYLNITLERAKEGYPISESILCFLRTCDITEDEFSSERAYKIWQRSKQYKKFRRLCHLRQNGSR